MGLPLEAPVELDGILEGDLHHAQVCGSALSDLGFFCACRADGNGRGCQCQSSRACQREVEADGVLQYGITSQIWPTLMQSAASSGLGGRFWDWEQDGISASSPSHSHSNHALPALPQSFFCRPAEVIAPELIGVRLVKRHKRYIQNQCCNKQREGWKLGTVGQNKFLEFR